MRCMNVCLISREFPPFFGGGIGTYAIQWSRALAAAGHRVVVLTVTDDGVERRERDGNVTIIRLPLIRGQDWSAPDPAIATPEIVAAFHAFSKVSAFAIRIQQVLPDLIAEFAIDVIEAPDTGALAWFVMNYRRTSGNALAFPAVVTAIHSPSDWIARQNRQPQSSRADLELAAMEGDSVRWSDGLVCPSAALAAWSARHWDLSPDRIDVIPYPLGDLEPAARAAASAQPTTVSLGDGFEVLFAGRLEPRKGVDTLAAAFAIAARELPGLTLTLAGEDTPDPSGAGKFGENSLRSLVPPPLMPRVRVLGRQTPRQLSALRSRAGAVIIPSAMDNFPFTCIEAMAEGRLVIASSGGGTGEMVRDGVDGLLFGPYHAASCAQAMIRAAKLSLPERDRLQASAAGRILDLCADAKIVPRRIAHYQRAIEHARAPRANRGHLTMAIINRNAASDSVIRRLTDAVWHSGADFAHAWGRAGGVLAFSTPTIQSLALGSRAIGPVVATVDAIERAGLNRLLLAVPKEGEQLPGTAEFIAESSWLVTMLLAASGVQGTVVPDAVVDLNLSDLHPADRALAAGLKEFPARDFALRRELDAIHASRGWKVLQRIYGLLHVLRFRGLQRPDYHQVR